MGDVRLLGGWVRHGRVVAPVVDQADLEAAGLELLARYDEPHRHYHDTRHLGEVVGAVALLAEHARDLSAVMVAAWWHDAVYLPGADDNEVASAALATATLDGWEAAPDRALHIGDLIRMTATHRPQPHDADATVLSDADLAILASPPARYAEYVAGVRREFAVLPHQAFADGRAAVLRDLLDRDHIFSTPSGRARWEAPARENIERELRHLQDAHPS
ncbi:MAG: HD domain-containing protein [Angustibacter sp.]